MTSYNIAVTVGPNIFRPRLTRSQDVTNVGIFYDLIIRMIDDTDDILFDKKKSYADITRVDADLNETLNRGGVGVVEGLAEILRSNSVRNIEESKDENEMFADFAKYDKAAEEESKVAVDHQDKP